MPLKVICPKGCKVRVPSSKSGAVIRCPDCRAIIRVPKVDTVARESNKTVQAKLIGEPPVPREGPAYARSPIEDSQKKSSVNSSLDEPPKIDSGKTEPSPPTPSESKLSAIAPPPIGASEESNKEIAPPPIPAPDKNRTKRKRSKKSSSTSKRGTDHPAAKKPSDASKSDARDSDPNRESKHRPSESAKPSQPVFKLSDNTVPAPPPLNDDAGPALPKGGSIADSVIVEPPVEVGADAEILADAVGVSSPQSRTHNEPLSSVSANGEPRKVATSMAAGAENDIPSIGLEPDESKCLTARSLSIVMVIAGLFTMGPAIYQLYVWSQGSELVDIDRWVFVLFFLACIHFLYASFLVQLPDWSSVWVVSFLMLVMACLDALCLAGLTLGDASSPIAQALQISGELRSKAMLWVLCMLSIHALLCYFCGREAIRWKRTFDVYVSLLE